MTNRVVLSLLGALAAALAVIGTATVVTWRTGIAAAIAALGALGVPTIHTALASTTPSSSPAPAGDAEADVNSDEISLLPVGTPGAGGTEIPEGGGS